MNLTTDALVLLLTNERDELMKVFENRLVQFELRMQLILEQHPQCDCLKHENRVLEIVSNLETEFGKCSQQKLSSNVLQKKLLKQLEIFNESELLKQNRFNSHDLSTLNVEVGADDIDPKEVDVKNMNSEESTKNEVFGDSFRNTGNGSAQEKDRQNSFDHIEPLAQLMPLCKNAEIVFDRQIMLENNDKNLGLEREKSCNNAVNAQTSLTVIPSHNEADNTNDPLYSTNDASLSVYLQDVKEEINETGKDISWPMETSGCSETPYSRNSIDNASLINDTTQLKSEIIEHDNEVVIKLEGKTVDQSVDVFDKSARVNQLTSPTDQSQPESCCKCEKCDSIFAKEKMKHPERCVVKRYKCEFCSYSSDVNGNLKKHLCVHTKEKPFQCSMCLKRFTQESSFKTHSRIHTKECSYKCNKCGKKFTQLGHMQTHILNVHDKIKSFVCNVCDFTCGRSRYLDTHMLTHIGVRNYKCQYCDRRFSQSSNMRKHERIHTGEKPYKCKECSAAFTQSSNLHDHTIIHHTKRYPYRCSVCDKGYLIPRDLKKHESRCCKS